MRKCAICKNNPQDYTWQPELDNAFYLPGSHIRGFMTVPICSGCMETVKLGVSVRFIYRKQEYRASLRSLEKIEKLEEIPIYPDLDSAQPALERGETVRIEMEPFKIDPWLVQKALDLQAQERLEQWRQQQR